MKHPKNIFLIGPMGAGKSVVGRYLARSLHLAFVDSDDEIESRTGVDIPFIFEKEGEVGFRKREAVVIDDLSKMDGIVLATGGGAILEPESRSCLGARGFVVYLYTTVDQQVTRTLKGRERPLLENTDPGRRSSSYCCCATHCIAKSPISLLRLMVGRLSLLPVRSSNRSCNLGK